jgi:hypothetical protein
MPTKLVSKIGEGWEPDGSRPQSTRGKKIEKVRPLGDRKVDASMGIGADTKEIGRREKARKLELRKVRGYEPKTRAKK